MVNNCRLADPRKKFRELLRDVVETAKLCSQRMRFPTLARWPVLTGAVWTTALLAVAGCASRAPLLPSIPDTPVNYYVRVDRAATTGYDVSVAFDAGRD